MGLTIFALLRRFRPPQEMVRAAAAAARRAARPSGTDLRRRRSCAPRTTPAHGYLLVPAVLVRLLLPIALVVALHLFLRGHNQPGGGFVAGLVVAIAFIAQYMVGGTQWVEDRMNLHPPRWIAVGLLLAVATGLGSLAFGYPFLTTHTAHVTLPVLGELHLPSAALLRPGRVLRWCWAPRCCC